MCEEDVMDLGLSSHALAKEILLLIEEIKIYKVLFNSN
jgi:hypothetical protein